MKKTLLSLFALVAIGANAQLPAGSTAPAFTANDINGNSHNLYANYLNQGKPVLMDISATWCGPCWNYHNTHAMADFYYAYGPIGSNEAMVLFIEGDGSTTLADLQGTTSGTRGNWIEDTPYPIIDSATIANQYQIGYFPTIYRICANGIVTEINPLNAVGLRNSFNSGCGTMQGVPNHAKISAVNVFSCGGSTNVTATLRNYGNNNITSAVVVLKENGNVIATQNFSGNVSQFTNGNITFSSVSVSSGASYTVEVQSLNGGALHYSGFGTANLTASIAQAVSSTNLQVRVYTDNYPGEISWRIKNSSGTIVANGGPYQAGSGSGGAGGADANTTKVHNITIPATDNCYSVELLDSYGDGWTYNSAGAPVSGLEVFDSGQSVVFVDGRASFSNSAPRVRPAAFRYATASVDGNQLSKFSVYPNPSTGIFNVSTTEAVDVRVVDISGKIVYTAKSIENDAVINLSSLNAGVYLLQVSGETINKTEKLIIK